MATAKRQDCHEISIDADIMKDLLGTRWIVRFKLDGGISIKPVAYEEFLTTDEKILDGLNEKLQFNPQVLATFVTSAIKNMASRYGEKNNARVTIDQE